MQIFRYQRTPDDNPYSVSCPELANSNITYQITGVDPGTDKVYHLGMVEQPLFEGDPYYSHSYTINADNTVTVITSTYTLTDTGGVSGDHHALQLRNGTQLNLEIYITVFSDTPIDKAQQLIYGKAVQKTIER